MAHGIQELFVPPYPTSKLFGFSYNLVVIRKFHLLFPWLIGEVKAWDHRETTSVFCHGWRFTESGSGVRGVGRAMALRDEGLIYLGIQKPTVLGGYTRLLKGHVGFRDTGKVLNNTAVRMSRCLSSTYPHVSSYLDP